MRYGNYGERSSGRWVGLTERVTFETRGVSHALSGGSKSPVESTAQPVQRPQGRSVTNMVTEEQES